jgi:hypothetical protein
MIAGFSPVHDGLGSKLRCHQGFSGARRSDQDQRFLRVLLFRRQDEKGLFKRLRQRLLWIAIVQYGGG